MDQDVKLIIETPDERPAIKDPKPAAAFSNNDISAREIKQPAANSKLSALSKIREQFKSTGAAVDVNDKQPLNDQQLAEVWKKFVGQLKEEKNSAAQSFDRAILRITDDFSFEAVTANNLEQKFIEMERLKASAFLQQELNNRSIQFTIIIEEQHAQREPVERTLTSKEQFLKMAEQYPLVRELKERLKMDLDY